MVNAPERAVPVYEDRMPVAAISDMREISESRAQLPRVALALAQSIEQLFQSLRDTTNMSVDPTLTSAQAIEREFQADPSFFQFPSDEEDPNSTGSEDSEVDPYTPIGASIESEYDFESPFREDEHPNNTQNRNNQTPLRR